MTTAKCETALKGNSGELVVHVVFYVLLNPI